MSESKPKAAPAGWIAWDNQQPGAKRSLNVVGHVKVANPGVEASLVPDGGVSTPETLLLKVVTKQKPGIWPPMITVREVTYQVKPYKGGKDTVIVTLADGSKIKLKVQIIS
jgi:hypothetical protein